MTHQYKGSACTCKATEGQLHNADCEFILKRVQCSECHTYDGAHLLGCTLQPACTCVDTDDSTTVQGHVAPCPYAPAEKGTALVADAPPLTCNDCGFQAFKHHRLCSYHPRYQDATGIAKALDSFSHIFAQANTAQTARLIDVLDKRSQGMEPLEVVRRLELGWSVAADEFAASGIKTPLTAFLHKLRAHCELLAEDDLNSWLEGIMFGLREMSTEDFLAALTKAARPPREPVEGTFDTLLEEYADARSDRRRANERMLMAQAHMPSRALDALRAQAISQGEQLVVVRLKGTRNAASNTAMTNGEARKFVELAMGLALKAAPVASGGYVERYSLVSSAAASDE